MVGRIAELALTHDDQAQEPMGRMLVRHGDAAEHLHRAVRDLLRRKPILGMIHMPALPAAPANDQTMDELVGFALSEARKLEAAGLDACIVENVGDVALLRMLAVAPERRGEGLGYVLVEAATDRARAQGVKQLYLVTDGAQGYFGEKLGFAAIDRKDVDPGIAHTAEYLLARSKSATWMRRDL